MSGLRFDGTFYGTKLNSMRANLNKYPLGIAYNLILFL